MNPQDYDLVIRYLEGQVAALSRRGPSEELGHRLNELGQAWFERSRPGTAGDSDRKRAVEHFRKALENFGRSSNPKWWAAVHYNMGNALADMQEDRAASQEKAIECYNKTFEVYREQDPELRFDWATAHYELGLAFSQRLRGSRRENLSRSIEHYQTALRVFTLREYPDQYRCTQQNLASTLSDLADVP